MWFVYKSIFAERRYMSYSTRKRTSDDIIVKEFWRNNERFADLFNAVLFKGKCVIKAENLQEIDTDVSGTIRVQEYKETLKRARDVVKKYYNGVEFNILGLSFSPIKGPEGNREYLVYFTKDKEKEGSFEMSQIDEVVKESHSQL